MKERPIIFSSEMVRAILEERKTQTRRVIKPQPIDNWKKDIIGAELVPCSSRIKKERWLWKDKTNILIANVPFKCPYGKVGDFRGVNLPRKETCPCCGYTYRDKRIQGDHSLCDIYKITLKITDLRVERLQQICEIDYINEGIVLPYRVFGDGDSNYYEGIESDYRHRFEKLWNSLVKKGFKWENNPWVWVISFKKLTPKNK